MGDKSVETLGSKILFWSVLVSPQNNVVISISSTAQTTVRLHRPQCDCTDHSAFTTLNWGAGGIRELTLGAKYRTPRIYQIIAI